MHTISPQKAKSNEIKDLEPFHSNITFPLHPDFFIFTSLLFDGTSNLFHFKLSKIMSYQLSIDG